MLLDSEGFVMAIEVDENSSAPKGSVVSQSPLGATNAPKGSTINVVISGSSVLPGAQTAEGEGEGDATSEKIKVPDLMGKDETTAKSMLTTAGLNWGTITEEHNDAVAAGLVLSQSVAPETETDRGTPVDFIVSLGSSTYTCHLDISAPGDYFIGSEAIIVVSDVTNAEVGRATTTSFPYTITQTGISSASGFVMVQYQGVDGQWHQTSPVAVNFVQE